MEMDLNSDILSDVNTEDTEDDKNDEKTYHYNKRNGIHNPFKENDDFLNITEEEFENNYPKKKGSKISHDIKSIRKNPQENYFEFGKPEFLDENGLQYKITRSSFRSGISSFDGTANDESEEIKEDQREEIYNTNYNTKVMTVRIPKNLHNDYDLSTFDNKDIELYNIHSQILYKGKITGTRFKKGRKTGIVIIEDFTAVCKLLDSSKYERYLSFNSKEIKKDTNKYKRNNLKAKYNKLG